jgi:hypothetical protein
LTSHEPAIRLTAVPDSSTPTTTAGTRGDLARRSLVVAAVGLAAGLLTLLGQAVLDDDWNRLANSGAVWLTVAFGVGAAMVSDRQAAVAGLGSLLMALLGYQLAASVAQAPMSTSAVLIWSATAIVGGPVFGLSGRRWRSDRGRGRLLAMALLGAVYVAEGANTLLSIPELANAGWAEVIVGVGVPVVLGRDRAERLGALGLLVPLALLGVLVYQAIDRLFLMG